jgi:peptidoglycan/LPS O-acetylase OafA/YrhL
MEAVTNQAAWAQGGANAAPVSAAPAPSPAPVPAGPAPASQQEALPLEGADVRPKWLDRGRIPALDGLRAISIALVFLEHGGDATGYHAPGIMRRVVGTIGTVGVDVFFAISGFLITLLLLRELHRTERISLKGFYVRRFLRLMPAAIVFLLTVLVMQGLGRGGTMTGRNWLHVVTYTVNFDPHATWVTGHLWSLSIEEQFYLLWPVALVLLGPRRAGIGAVAWLLGAPVVRFVMLRLHPHDMGRFDNWTPIRVDCIAAGCLLALVAGNAEFRRRTRASAPAAMLLIAGAIALIFLSFLAGLRVAVYGVTVGQSVRALCISALIWFSINHAETVWGRLLEWKPFVIVGVLSYSLYLWQQPFLAPKGQAWVSSPLHGLILAVSAAILSYVFVERPFLRLKDRLDRRHA